MEQRFFDECKTIEDVKNKYRELAKMYHPDMQGGDLVLMQVINNEYELAIKRVLKGQTFESAEREEAELKFSEEYRQAVEKIIMLPDLIIELIGKWLWVSGKTYDVRAELKAAGYEYSGNKKMWYFRTSEHKHMANTGETMSIEEIRAKYGSEQVTPNRKNRRRNIEKQAA